MSNDPCYPHEWKLEMWVFYEVNFTKKVVKTLINRVKLHWFEKKTIILLQDYILLPGV